MVEGSKNLRILGSKNLKVKVQVWEGIQKGVFIPNDTSWKCKNCSYKVACDSWFIEKFKQRRLAS